jgi:hypothetical protein
VRLLSLENGEGVGRVCRPENACRDAPLGAATSVGTGGGVGGMPGSWEAKIQ